MNLTANYPKSVNPKIYIVGHVDHVNKLTYIAAATAAADIDVG